MAWENDLHGIVFKSSEIKLYYNNSHTWGMKLSQLYKQTGTVRIITYSLPDIEYVFQQFNRRPTNIWLLCHSEFLSKAEKIKQVFPEIRIATRNDIHAKVLLIEPNTVYVTSANFGNSTWHETTIGVRSKEAHDAYLNNAFIPLWKNAKEVK